MITSAAAARVGLAGGGMPIDAMAGLQQSGAVADPVHGHIGGRSAGMLQNLRPNDRHVTPCGVCGPPSKQVLCFAERNNVSCCVGIGLLPCEVHLCLFDALATSTECRPDAQECVLRLPWRAEACSYFRRS